MSLRSSSQLPPVKYLNAIGSRHELNPSRRICHLRAVPLGHVADKVLQSLLTNISLSFKVILMTHRHCHFSGVFQSVGCPPTTLVFLTML